MVRKFKIEFDSGFPDHRNDCGIYKMYIGDYLYIGCSKQMRTRASEHIAELQRLFKKHGRAYRQANQQHYLLKVYIHLVKNKDVDTIRFGVLELCEQENLYIAEQLWFDRHIEKHRIVLNVSLTNWYQKLLEKYD